MQKYTVTRHFRCTAAESEEIERRAEGEKKPLSAYLRDAALKRNLPVLDQRALTMLALLEQNEMKIGVNINQAVRLCNSKKNVSRQDYAVLTDYLVSLVKLRREMIFFLKTLQEE